MKVAHLADIHIPNSPKRHQEFRVVFDRTYQHLRTDNPDRIVIVGDLFHNFIEISNEAIVLASEFLRNLADIAPVIITRGNHDLRKRNLKRVDSVQAIVDTIHHPNVTYYNQTGIFEDGSVRWVVWHHGDKHSPWKGVERENGFVYIDLFHDPVTGAEADNGFGFTGKYRKISHFQGDLSFFGDIHKRQYFSGRTKAYCGSLVQQNFKESLTGHGYLLWDTADKTVEERDIPNDWSFITIPINRFSDLDDLELLDQFPRPSRHVRVRVQWEALPADFTVENEQKINEQVEQAYGLPPDKITTQAITPENIEVSVEDFSKEELVFGDEIYREFLAESGCQGEFIEEVIKIEHAIQQRLEITEEQAAPFMIHHLEAENFRSYKHFSLNLDEIQGITQVGGFNRAGKSTFFAAICYWLYGKTQETLDKQKNGDARYINNKLDVDHCSVKGVLEVGGQKFGIVRQTQIKWNRSHTEITASPTTVNFYVVGPDGTIDETQPLEGEVKKDTQRSIEEHIGTYDDFIRISLTNADNLNQLLSLNRSVFIDTILRDAGLEIFEKKNAAFKEWKKEQSAKTDRIKLDLGEAKEKINLLKKDVADLTDASEREQQSQEGITNDINVRESEIEALRAKIHKIPDALIELEPLKVEAEIHRFEDELRRLKQQEKQLKTQIDLLPGAYDEEELNGLESEQEKLREQFQDLKHKEKQLQNSSEEYANLHNQAETRRQRIENDLAYMGKTFAEQLIGFIKLEVDQVTERLVTIRTKKEQIADKINWLREKISAIESTTKCKVCGKEIPDGFLYEEIKELDGYIEEEEEISKNYQALEIEEESLAQKEGVFKETLTLPTGEMYKTFLDSGAKAQYCDHLAELRNQGVVLRKELKEVEEEKQNNALKIASIKDSIELIGRERSQLIKKGEENLLVLAELKEAKLRYQEKIQLEDKLSRLPVQSENYQIKIDRLKKDLDDFNDSQETIRMNQEYEKKIDVIKREIIQLKTVSEQHSFVIKDLLVKRAKIEEKLNLWVQRVETYNQQQYQEQIWAWYQRCVKRDGIPTLLLQKSVNYVNSLLADLLEEVNFRVYLNDSLELKMYELNHPDSLQNALECSGMERTFISVALKLALRQINQSSKSSMLLLDEVTGKLVDESVDTFNQLLLKAKKYLTHIFIVEHNHEIPYDHWMEVNRDMGGVSRIILDNPV